MKASKLCKIFTIMPNMYGIIFKKGSQMIQPNVNGILPQSDVANGNSIVPTS